MSLYIPRGLKSKAVASIPKEFKGVMIDDITNEVVFFDSDGIILTLSGAESVSTTEIVANPGGGQANAVQLISNHNKIDTVESPGDSVKMPRAKVGLSIIVNNSASANSVNVFPLENDKFEGLAVDIATALAAGSFIKLFCYVNGIWESE